MPQPTVRTAIYGKKASAGGLYTIEDMSRSTGFRFFVDAGASGVGSTASYGRSPDAPLATWALAFSLDVLTPSQSDIVYLMPGHVEDVIAAATISCDIAGVSVIGLGDKDNRPIISFTTIDSADIDIDAADITFENISFRCDIASLIAAIDVNASGFTIRNCSFMGTDAADEAFLISIITDAAADDITIEDCQFHYLNAEDGTAITTVSTECIRLVGADRAKIQRNYISGDFTTSAINNITTECDDILILENIIQNIATENITGGIDLDASTTGFLDKNVLYVADPTDPEDAIDDGACAIGVNWVTNVIGTAPVIWGAAASGGVEGLIGGIDDATTDSLHGKLGTDTEMSDTSIFDMITAANVVAVQAGTTIIVTKTITSTDIKNDGVTPLNAPLTGAASGDLMLEEIIMQTDSTGLAGGTTIQVISDNTDGLTGNTVPIWDEAVGNLGSNATINNTSADVNLLPMMLESGKKLYINNDTADGTGGGTVEVIMLFRRASAGATIAAA